MPVQQDFFDRFLADVLPAQGDVLLIVPPLADIALPPLSVSLLQAIGRQAGFRVDVLYADLVFAHLVGPRAYEFVAGNTPFLLGERVFCAAAYGFPPLGRDAADAKRRFLTRGQDPEAELHWSLYEECSRAAVDWSLGLARSIADREFSIIGCTTMFQQTSASVALLKEVKRLRPDVVTIIGGANCQGEMADGIASLTKDIDFIFSHESDLTFPAFLNRILAGDRPPERVIVGQPFDQLDTLPTPSYVNYFEQMEWLFRGSDEAAHLWKQIRIPFESSRGCWWGEKHHCTFCALNGLGMGFREKSADRLIVQLQDLVREHPFDKLGTDRMLVYMNDNILPHGYFRTLIPRLKDEVPQASLFYELKANLTLEKVVALREAGVVSFEAGVETLSTSYARRMRKGVTAAGNIALMRYVASTGLLLVWNLLWDFPGDEVDELQQMLELVPLLHHLPPPTGLHTLSIERFSPYFDDPAAHGLSNVRPLDDYRQTFPAATRIQDLATFFDADYVSASREHPDLITELRRQVRRWRQAWDGTDRPVLRVHRAARVFGGKRHESFVLVDTRGLPGTASIVTLDHDEALLLLVKRPLDGTPGILRALENRWGVARDGSFVPLATAHVDVLRYFEDLACRGDKRRERATLAELPAYTEQLRGLILHQTQQRKAPVVPDHPGD